MELRRPAHFSSLGRVQLLDRGAHEYTGSSGYSQKQGHRDWLLIKGNRKRKALSVGEWVLEGKEYWVALYHNLGNLPACGWEKVKALGRKARGKGAVKLHLSPVGGKPRVSASAMTLSKNICPR